MATQSQLYYAVSPSGMTDGIEHYLTPVIDQLHADNEGFTDAQGAVSSAYEATAAGWYGATGNGTVKPASDQFLSDASDLLKQLNDDQAGVVASLEEYRSMLKGHVGWAQQTDEHHAQKFHAIGNGMDQGGR